MSSRTMTAAACAVSAGWRKASAANGSAAMPASVHSAVSRVSSLPTRNITTASIRISRHISKPTAAPMPVATPRPPVNPRNGDQQ